MARLQKYELDAVVSTVIEQIKENNKNKPEQIQYQNLKKLQSNLYDEISKKIKEFKKVLREELQLKYPELVITESPYNNGINIENPLKPKSNVDEKTIERELIVSNIKGDIDETIKKIVEKYK